MLSFLESGLRTLTFRLETNVRVGISSGEDSVVSLNSLERRSLASDFTDTDELRRRQCELIRAVSMVSMECLEKDVEMLSTGIPDPDSTVDAVFFLQGFWN